MFLMFDKIAKICYNYNIRLERRRYFENNTKSLIRHRSLADCRIGGLGGFQRPRSGYVPNTLCRHRSVYADADNDGNRACFAPSYLEENLARSTEIYRQHFLERS